LTRLKLVHSHFPHTNTHAHNRASEIQILFKNSAILASTSNDLFWGHSCQCCCECVLLYFDELLNKTTTTTASAKTVVAVTQFQAKKIVSTCPVLLQPFILG